MRAVSGPWALVLTPSGGDPARRVGGLSIALRLALDAARAGAIAVVLDAGSGVSRQVLSDPRLKIPVLDAVPEDVRSVSAGASIIFHRDVFKAAAANRGNVALTLDTPKGPAAYAFSPIDVADGESAARAEAELFRSLRKPQDGWTSRHLNRYISLSLSRWLVRTPLSPNQVSVGILAIGLLGAWLASRGTYGTMLLGAFLFQAQSVLDGCDGEMSRVTYRGSLLGEWLDTIGDDLTNYGFFAGTSLGLHAATGSELYLAAGAVTVGCGVTASLVEYRYLVKIGSGDLLRYPTSQVASQGKGFFAIIAPLFKRDTFVLLTLVAALFDLLGPMLVVFAFAAVGILVNVFIAEAQMARGRRAPGSSSRS